MSGEAKHTAGPWTIERYGNGDSLVLHSDSETRICFMATPGGSPGALQTIEANARLIAAAPEMQAEIDALTKALTGLTCGGSEFFIRKGERYTADIPACVDYVRRTRTAQHETIVNQIKARKAAEALTAELLAALKAVVSVADRKTAEFDLAHAAISKAQHQQKAAAE